MKRQRHFERARGVASREVAQISTLISDLDRVIRALDCDIATEEERTQVSDPFHAASPRRWQRAGTILRTPSPRSKGDLPVFSIWPNRGSPLRGLKTARKSPPREPAGLRIFL
jgi:hypothetical protein